MDFVPPDCSGVVGKNIRNIFHQMLVPQADVYLNPLICVHAILPLVLSTWSLGPPIKFADAFHAQINAVGL